MRLLITSMIMLCMVTGTHGTKVIIVHGSFATNEPWYQPGGDFFEAVNKQARTYNIATESFSWSGIPNYKNIIDGAKKLAQLINNNMNEQLILIGHSHGGNVILLASQLLETAPPAAIPVLIPATTEPLNRKFTIKKPLDEYKKTIQQFYQAFFSWQSLRQLFENEPIKEPIQPPIAHVFLLGTPINSLFFTPAMQHIGTVWNLYSTADIVQPLGGLCKKTLPYNARVHNFEVSITTSDATYNPTHSDMHNPTIGSWLIPLAKLYNPASIASKKLCFSQDINPLKPANIIKKL